ncbi:MAG: SatD family protein [Ornithinimicrobium sp.]
MSERVTLLGDMVGSRKVEDRQHLHDHVTGALARVSAIGGEGGLAITAGDEFQGTYARLGNALEAALAVRMLLEPAIGVRFGIGRGDVTVLDADTGAQDGPGWWAARSAIEHVEQAAGRTGTGSLRTAYEASEADPLQSAVNAALVCQDLVLDSFDERTWTILRGSHGGMTQQQIADDIGISRQAVQQRRASSGIPMLLSAAAHLASLP